MTTPQFDNREQELAYFLAGLEDRQRTFVETAADEGFMLDYSLDSLANLEEFLLYDDIPLSDKSDEAVSLRVDCWTYLGEVMRRNYGGAWHVSSNDANTANQGQFVIEGHSPLGTEYVPLRSLTAFLLRRKCGFFLSNIQNQLAPVEIDLTGLPTEE